MEYIIIFFGLITFIQMILGAINALVWKDETVDSILDIIVHICAGITGGFALCLLFGQNHILNEHEYREYKELKKPGKTNLILILDVSGSCKEASEMMITFMYLLQSVFQSEFESEDRHQLI